MCIDFQNFKILHFTSFPILGNSSILHEELQAPPQKCFLCSVTVPKVSTLRLLRHLASSLDNILYGEVCVRNNQIERSQMRELIKIQSVNRGMMELGDAESPFPLPWGDMGGGTISFTFRSTRMRPRCLQFGSFRTVWRTSCS